MLNTQGGPRHNENAEVLERSSTQFRTSIPRAGWGHHLLHVSGRHEHRRVHHLQRNRRLRDAAARGGTLCPLTPRARAGRVCAHYVGMDTDLGGEAT